MMRRCGWGTKEGQETVPAVEISREVFVWALRKACLSHHVPELHGDPATWKRQLRQAPADVTPPASEIHGLARVGDTGRATALLPHGRPSPLEEGMTAHLFSLR
ncbi:hypothetical protein GCM10010377_16020 [Streptomyces viridiviolaceus]|uniref:DUF4291 family protein n=1 Tax=Streptomyces viridiviolaceus TaxID=68282 RepID=A0ABW2DSV0_9ACTN|nr:DUF4291 family protein [Streptomyces viridiviolaceus]GHB26875.1 hypothetical protein GCM10010377_16020 [Streptomyces viridiviolaceus]